MEVRNFGDVAQAIFTLLLGRVLKDPLSTVVDAIFRGLGVVFSREIQAIDSSYERLIEWNRNEITSHFTVRQAVASLFAAAAFVAFILANYVVLSFSLKNILPQEGTTALFTGIPFLERYAYSDILAASFVFGEVIAGMMLAEALGASKLLSVEGWDDRVKVLVYRVSLVILIGFLAAEIAMAVARHLEIAGDPNIKVPVAAWLAIPFGIVALVVPLCTSLAGAFIQHLLLSGGVFVLIAVVAPIRALGLALRKLAVGLDIANRAIHSLIIILSWPFYLVFSFIPNANSRIDNSWLQFMEQWQRVGAVADEAGFGPVPGDDAGVGPHELG
jgi:hypothetical protein